MDKFLRHPLVQAISGAFVGGVMGFALTLLFANIVFPNVTADTVIALFGAGVLAYFGARAGYAGGKEAPPEPRRRLTSLLPTFAGASLMVAGACTILGMTGNVVLLCAIAAGFLVATMLAILP